MTRRPPTSPLFPYTTLFRSLSEVSYQYLIPLIDLGTEIGASGAEIQSLDARVSFVGPGRPCLFCSRVITQERIRLESYHAAEQERVLAMGYSKDIRLTTPAVMDLNMRAASLAGLFVRHLYRSKERRVGKEC